jgi:probable HAF family extracellular repeat protein
MTDLGSLGGTFNFGQCVNARLEVIGNSNLPDDQTFHGYRWRNGKMKDLGTLGGPDSEAVWINNSGDIAGSADLPTPGIHDAVVWKRGKIYDLGSLPGDACSRGRAINARGQVVGGTSDCHNFLHAFVWEPGGPMRDLNKLIPPNSGLQLTNAFNINDRGEILAKSFAIGTTPNDDADLGHLVLLIPCGHDDHEGQCSGHDRDDDAGTPSVSTPMTSRATDIPHTSHSLTAEDGAVGWQMKMGRRLSAPKPAAH